MFKLNIIHIDIYLREIDALLTNLAADKIRLTRIKKQCQDIEPYLYEGNKTLCNENVEL